MQRLFDFGNGGKIDNIWCGQQQHSNDLICEISGADRAIISLQLVRLFQMSLPSWIFEAKVDSTVTRWAFSIERNGVSVARAVH